MKKSFLVVGLGRFGSEVARQLAAQGKEVLAIDRDAELVQQISDQVTHAVVGDCRDKNVLKALDVGALDCAVVAIGDDLASSVLTVINLKEMGVPYVVCKAYDDTHRKVLEKLGADKVMIPEKEIAARLAKSLASVNVLDYISLSDGAGIVELPVPKKWIGQSLITLNVRAKYHVNVIAIGREGNINTSPAPDYAFRDGDVLILIGDTKAIAAVQKL